MCRCCCKPVTTVLSLPGTVAIACRAMPNLWDTNEETSVCTDCDIKKKGRGTHGISLGRIWSKVSENSVSTRSPRSRPSPRPIFSKLFRIIIVRRQGRSKQGTSRCPRRKEKTSRKSTPRYWKSTFVLYSSVCGMVVLTRHVHLRHRFLLWGRWWLVTVRCNATGGRRCHGCVRDG